MTRWQKLYKWTLFLLGVPTCVGCDERLVDPYSPICPECLRRYRETKTSNCSQCGRLLHKCSCTNEYLSTHFVKQHFKVFRYQNREENEVANALIYSLKKDNRADVLEFLRDELAASLSDFIDANEDVLFTNVPRRRKAIIKYGMDHAQDLARSLAKHFGCEYRSILASKSKLAQKKTHGQERIDNVIFDFKERNPETLKGRTVVIVDDIVTTGASVATAGALLRSLGAKKIVAASIAATYRDIESPLRKAEMKLKK